MRPNSAIRIVLLSALAAVAFLPSAPAQQQSPGEQIASEIQAENCIVQYIDKTPIPARAEGQLLDLMFEEGDPVNENDVLAVIDDTQAQLTKDLHEAKHKEARLNAANDVNLRNAENSAQLAKAEAESYKELRKDGAIPYWEMKKKEFEAMRADLAIELAQMNTKIAEVQMLAARSELQIAEFELTKRQVLAPLTGQIEERIVQKGQWVRPGDPIATLIQMDKLRVEGDIDALLYPGRVRKGAPVQVVVYTQADKGIRFTGKLGYVSSEINSNDEYRVWVEVENQRDGDDWLIKPGMKAEIVIQNAGQVQ